MELLITTTRENTCRQAAESLPKILKTNEQYCQVVSKLKHCLSKEMRQTNYDLFDKSYSVIWQCAQNLPYPEFYRAWHDHNPDNSNPTPQTFDPQ